nr:MAG TPA: hypothetical protein [Caudoviricetes sp.]
MNDSIKTLADIIDIRSSEPKTEYFATVLNVVTGSLKAKVQLSGTDVAMTILNKSGETLSVGDSVIVKAINGDMSNSIISYRFGEAQPLGGSGYKVGAYTGDGSGARAITGVGFKPSFVIVTSFYLTSQEFIYAGGWSLYNIDKTTKEITSKGTSGNLLTNDGFLIKERVADVMNAADTQYGYIAFR